MSAADAHRAGRLSAWGYFASVLVLTGLGIGVAMALRPAFAFTVRDFLGLEKPRLAATGSFYAVRVQPLFDQHCAGCHDGRMDKGDLRLDSFAATLRGGRHGAVVTPGQVKASELFNRITLPQSDDRAMPPDGKTPLSRDEQTVIRLWIENGASGELAARSVKGAPRLVPPVRIPRSDPAGVARQRAPLAAEVRMLQARFPGMIAYESRGSAMLEVSAVAARKNFGDAEMKALLPLKARIVRLDLSGTAVTDAAVTDIAALAHLRVLRLADTAITPAALAPLRQRGIVVLGGADGI
jgi:hypothetical protein